MRVPRKIPNIEPSALFHALLSSGAITNSTRTKRINHEYNVSCVRWAYFKNGIERAELQHICVPNLVSEFSELLKAIGWPHTIHHKNLGASIKGYIWRKENPNVIFPELALPYTYSFLNIHNTVFFNRVIHPVTVKVTVEDLQNYIEPTKPVKTVYSRLLEISAELLHSSAFNEMVTLLTQWKEKTKVIQAMSKDDRQRFILASTL